MAKAHILSLSLKSLVDLRKLGLPNTGMEDVWNSLEHAPELAGRIADCMRSIEGGKDGSWGFDFHGEYFEVARCEIQGGR